MMLEVFATFREKELDLLKSLFRQGRERGEFTLAETDEAAELFLHMFHGLRMRFMQFSPRLIADGQGAYGQLQAEMRLATEIFLKGIGSTSAATNGAAQQ